ncbi:nucleotidyltransferase family protein [Methanosarcina horonobensis]|uniref:nucleotidyltransferase family protein n=1 Tax=Methanosarcina horonobensis TaxID=418008 RepID=UPI000A40A64C|nr:nucleotidyltransferase family protein [Methanosarcina horonobensis]
MSSFHSTISLNDHKQNILTWKTLTGTKSCSKKISSFLEKEGATKVAIFGSYARGEEKPESDIDILVEFSETKGLLTLVRIERELSELLGVKVDLLTEASISVSY